jgi:hypothetical protein
MVAGLLSGISDPEFMKRSEERGRIIKRIAEQMGLARSDAAQALWRFECTTSSAGQELH